MVQWFDPPSNGGITPYENLGALGKVGLILQNVADPSTLPKYNQAVSQEQQNRLKLSEQQNQIENRTKLQQLASDPNFAALSPAEQFRQVGAITGDPTAAIQYNADQQMTPLQRAQLAIQQQQLGLQQQAASRAGRVDYGFTKDEAGNIYRTNPQTGQVELAQAASAGSVPFKAPITSGLPEGFMWGAGENGQPSAIPIPGVSGANGQSSKPTVDSEKSRRLGSAILSDLSAVEGLAFDKDGSLRRSVVGQSAYGDGRTFSQGLNRAVQNLLYLKSGATATDPEIQATLRNYAPDPLDTKEQAASKLASFRSFAEDSIPAYAKPQGVSASTTQAPANLQSAAAAELARRRGGK